MRDIFEGREMRAVLVGSKGGVRDAWLRPERATRPAVFSERAGSGPEKMRVDDAAIVDRVAPGLAFMNAVDREGRRVGLPQILRGAGMPAGNLRHHGGNIEDANVGVCPQQRVQRIEI